MSSVQQLKWWDVCSPMGAALWISLFALLMFSLGLGERHLWGADEPRVAGIAAEMALNGDWVVPRLNGEPFLEIPPLHWWASAATFKTLGISTATAKLPSALAAAACVIMAFFLARSLGLAPLTSFVCGAMLATAPEFWIVGRRCIMDTTLCLFICLSMLAFHKFIKLADEGQRKPLWALLFLLGLSCAVLSKGLIGLAIPVSALSAWLLVRKDCSIINWALLAGASLLALIPVSLWLFALYGHLGMPGVKELVWTNNFGRFTGGHAEHVEPFYFYFTRFPLQFLPWTLAAVVMAFLLIKGGLAVKFNKSSLFLGCWILIPFTLLCIAAGKRPIYLLPLYPAVAIFAGQLFEWVMDFEKWRRPLKIGAQIAAAVLLAGFLIADIGVMAHNNKGQSYEPLFRKAIALEQAGGKMVLYKPDERYRGAAVFYLNHTVKEIDGHDDLASKLKGEPGCFALANSETIPASSGFKELERFKIGKRKYAVLLSWNNAQRQLAKQELRP